MDESQHDRNAAIYAARQSGKTLRATAAEFGISPERVRQICMKWERRFHPDKWERHVAQYRARCLTRESKLKELWASRGWE